MTNQHASSSNHSPIWHVIYCTDYSRLLADMTGKYPAELEIGQDCDDTRDSEPGKWLVYRICLERLEPGQVEWFTDSLPDVARSIGSSEAELTTALESVDIKARAWAYESIGGYHGYANFDSYPLELTTAEFNERWSK